MTFPGFPTQAIEFFAAVRENNNREWFEQNKPLFQEFVQEPAQEFVAVLGARLQALSPGMQFDTSLNGSGSIMRIYRDVRFSKDKSPYKDWQGIRFWEGPNRKESVSGLYFGFSADGGGIHVGAHGFSKEFLTRYREAILDERYGRELESILQSLPDGIVINGEQLKNTPRGFDPDHPRSELLKYKSQYLSAPDLTAAQLTHGSLVDVCAEFFRSTLPFHHWMVELGARL